MLLFLLACSSKDGDKPHKDKGPDQGPDSSWTVPSGTTPPPFDAGALQQGLNQALLELLDLSAEPVLASYDAMMQLMDSYCPYLYAGTYSSSGSDAVSWYAQCNTTQGATFAGYGGQSGSAETGYQSVFLGGTVVAPDGRTMTGSGYWDGSSYGYGNATVRTSYLDGPFSYDGPEASGSWVQRQIQPHELEVYREHGNNGQLRSIFVDGEFTGMAGPVDTVDFSEISLDRRDDCPEPEGRIALRAADGADWFEVTFEGDCDGCGLAHWQGLEMGTVCGDFSPWMEGGEP